MKDTQCEQVSYPKGRIISSVILGGSLLMAAVVAFIFLIFIVLTGQEIDKVVVLVLGAASLLFLGISWVLAALSLHWNFRAIEEKITN